jgi:hypothetical protein
MLLACISVTQRFSPIPTPPATTRAPSVLLVDVDVLVICKISVNGLATAPVAPTGPGTPVAPVAPVDPIAPVAPS